MQKASLFQKLYDWVLEKAQHRLAAWWLALLSFAESSFFPIPPDVMLAPMVLADRAKAWWLATLTTLSSVAGGIVGYLIGWLLIGQIEPWLLDSHYAAGYLRALEWFTEYGVWVVFVAGFSPIPYKVFTIGAGAAAMNFPLFVIASLIGRGARYFLVAGLIYAGGPKAASHIRRYVDGLGWLCIGIVAVALLWLAIR
ncbi:MAG: YqaA family protein [Pseudomonadota bacterium]